MNAIDASTRERRGERATTMMIGKVAALWMSIQHCSLSMSIYDSLQAESLIVQLFMMNNKTSFECDHMNSSSSVISSFFQFKFIRNDATKCESIRSNFPTYLHGLWSAQQKQHACLFD